MNSLNDPPMIGNDPLLQEVVNAARIVAATDATAMVLGESGTGKELLARHLHRHSPRAGAPMVSVNCAALPESLAESLLFGHRKGAFTHATDNQAGFIRNAHGGTLFLDEVGELSPAVQAKLLRFLESGEVLPVGDATPREVNVRIIAATHRDLGRAVDTGGFRQDLYYRLFVVPLRMPSLRERPADIPLLLAHFLRDMAERHNLGPSHFLPCARKQLKRHSWPGNVRELRNLCERMAVLLPGREIGLENLPHEYRHADTAEAASRVPLPEGGLVLNDVERDLIGQALERTRGNRSQAARLLGLSRDTLLYRIKKFALDQ
ncbi:MAG: sigma-54 dependent transcriptional regulator [Pseudomonadota bacterium]